MSNFIYHKLLDACREPGCPVCRVEQDSVKRYLENQFYENVNSPKWRERLRGSLGFCHEHAWLAVEGRLGDALGFSIIYQDVLNHVLRRLDGGNSPKLSSRHWTSVLRRVPEQTRTLVEALLYAITPQKRCPVCEHREESTRMILLGLVEGLGETEVVAALELSEGLCLPHLAKSLEGVRDNAACETLLRVHRGKLEDLRAELAEFIRKNDYQVFGEGFGKEGDAWLRAITRVVGSRRGT